MLSFILASQNAGKAQELYSYINDKEISLVAAPVNLNPAETGSTFLQNALIKASTYYESLKKPVISDDSGLCLDAYPELMGVDTANYRPDLKDYSQRCQALIDLYKNDNEKNRTASFVCHLCLYLSPQEIFFFEGVLKGSIGEKLIGNSGFGYDPIFIPANQTQSLAELPEWKKESSHRAKAAKSLREFLYSISRKF